MPNLQYGAKLADEKKTAKAMGRELNISPKAAAEVCGAIRNKKVFRAKKILDEAISLEKPIPYKRYKSKTPHRKTQGNKIGRYPEKACREIKKILENAESNAEFKGLEAERLVVSHAKTNRGVKLRRAKPRGRWARSDIDLTSVEIIVKEE